MIPLNRRRALLLAVMMALVCQGLMMAFDSSGTFGGHTAWLLMTPAPGVALSLVLVFALHGPLSTWRKLGLVLLGGALYWPIGFCGAWALGTPGNHPDMAGFFAVLIPTVILGFLSWFGAISYLLLIRWMIQLPIEWKGVGAAGLWCIPSFTPLFILAIPGVPEALAQSSLLLGMVLWWLLFLCAASRRSRPA